jgi:hypothetical protein
MSLYSVFNQSLLIIISTNFISSVREKLPSAYFLVRFLIQFYEEE